MRTEKPFDQIGYLPVVVNRNLRPTFGTGIESVTPAHNLKDLKLSYEYDLPRIGCVNSLDGTLTKPMSLEGEKIREAKINGKKKQKQMEPPLVEKIIDKLEERNQFFATYKHECEDYRMLTEEDIIQQQDVSLMKQSNQ